MLDDLCERQERDQFVQSNERDRMHRPEFHLSRAEEDLNDKANESMVERMESMTVDEQHTRSR
jgi:hypothetical protein